MKDDHGIMLNIESDEAYRMASRLSALTGESLTRAVTEAIRERLDRQTLQSGTAGFKERLKALAGSDHRWRYDDVGAPH